MIYDNYFYGSNNGRHDQEKYKGHSVSTYCKFEGMASANMCAFGEDVPK